MVQAQENPLLFKVGKYLQESLSADLLNSSACKKFIQANNPGFYHRPHFDAAVQQIAATFARNKEVMRFIEPQNLLDFKLQVGSSLSRDFNQRIGDSPTAVYCGSLSGRVSSAIFSAKYQIQP